MIRLPIIAAIGALLLAGCESGAPMTMTELTKRHVQARGGEQAIESVKALRLDLEITEPGFTVRGRYVATRDGYMRIDIFAGEERVFTEALGPDGGWQMLKDQTTGTALSKEGEQALKRGLVGNLYGLHELSGLGYQFAFVGQETDGGKSFWTVDQTAPDGFSKRLFFDSESFLVVREMEKSALHPDLNSTKTRQQTRLDDFQETGGVVFSRRSQKFDLDKGEVVQTVIVKSIEINPEIDGTLFDRPA